MSKNTDSNSFKKAKSIYIEMSTLKYEFALGTVVSLGRQRWVNLGEFKDTLVYIHSRFQNSQGYAKRACLRKNKKIKNKTKQVKAFAYFNPIFPLYSIL